MMRLPSSFLPSSVKAAGTGATALLLLLTVTAGPAGAQTTIADLFNTGVDAAGTPLAGASIDPHYQMIANSFGSGSTTTFVTTNQLPGTWVADPASRYISVDTGDGNGTYTVTYRTTFTLPVNVNLSSVTIQGRWAVDNGGTNILINGNSTGFTSPGFGSFTSFNLPTDFFTAGTNNLDFAWTNGGGPGGLNVVFDTKTFTLNSVGGAAPEPGTLALAAFGLLGMAGMARRRSS